MKRIAHPAFSDFRHKWESLSDLQRSFLLAAHDIDVRMPHSEGLSKIMPPIAWRTVGLMSGVGLHEVDELVRTLSDLGFVMIIDAQGREMSLICGVALRALVEEHRRTRARWLVLISSMLAGAALFAGYLVGRLRN